MAVLRRLRKNEQTSGKGIGLQRLLANAGQAIDPVPEIDLFHRHQDAHWGSDLDHDTTLQKLLLRTDRSGAAGL
jgi:hypothetical protein